MNDCHYESIDVDVIKSAERTYTLGALSAAVRWRDLAVEEIDELVALARSEGASWEEIGERLGVTRQTAVRVYGDDRERLLEARRKVSASRRSVVKAAGFSTG